MAIKLETGSLSVSHMDGDKPLYEVGYGHVYRYYRTRAALKALDYIRYVKPKKGKDPINGFKIRNPKEHCYDFYWGNARYHFLSVDEDNTVTLNIQQFIADNLPLEDVDFIYTSVTLNRIQYDTLIKDIRVQLTEDLKGYRTAAVRAVNRFARKLQKKTNRDKYENRFLSFWNNGDYILSSIVSP